MPKDKAKDVDPDKMSRRQQFVATYRMARKTDTRLGLWLLGSFLVVGAVGFGLFWVLPPQGGLFDWVMAIVGGLLLGLLAAMIDLRPPRPARGVRPDGGPARAPPPARCRCCAAAGRPTRWSRSTSSRTSCTAWSARPGIILVGEGNPNRLRPLLTSERRKHERVAAETPIHEVICGRGEGEVPLPKLVRTSRSSAAPSSPPS